MKLKELLALNHECNTVYIRESDGNFSKPVFTWTLTSGNVPEEILERTVKHFQAGTHNKYNRVCGCLNVTLFMQKEV